MQVLRSPSLGLALPAFCLVKVTPPQHTHTPRLGSPCRKARHGPREAGKAAQHTERKYQGMVGGGLGCCSTWSSQDSGPLMPRGPGAQRVPQRASKLPVLDPVPAPPPSAHQPSHPHPRPQPLSALVLFPSSQNEKEKK